MDAAAQNSTTGSRGAYPSARTGETASPWTGGIRSYTPARARIVAGWLFAVAAAVACMVVVGGVTRLTDSGLSMVEWRPLIGWIPPTSDAEWSRVFDLYRQSSEYRIINQGMSLAEFRGIFWWEYAHRVLGRAIGMLFFLPFLFFLVRGWLTRRLALRLAGLLLLGGLQGVIGWWMVKSGLVDRTDVSQYRLAVHLAVAFLILGLLIRTGLRILGAGRRKTPLDPALLRFTWVVTGMVFLTVILGAFVAGLDAGYIYNEFPLMGGSLVPDDYWRGPTVLRNTFGNPVAVQLHHRWIAVLTVLTLVAWCGWARLHVERRSTRIAVHLVPIVAMSQALLGVTTLVAVVPFTLASMHQAGAVIVFSTVVAAGTMLACPPSSPHGSIRGQ